MESFEEDDEGEEGGEVVVDDDDDDEGKITAMREPELWREGPHIFSVFFLINVPWGFVYSHYTRGGVLYSLELVGVCVRREESIDGRCPVYGEKEIGTTASMSILSSPQGT